MIQRNYASAAGLKRVFAEEIVNNNKVLSPNLKRKRTLQDVIEPYPELKVTKDVDHLNLPDREDPLVAFLENGSDY